MVSSAIEGVVIAGNDIEAATGVQATAAASGEASTIDVRDNQILAQSVGVVVEGEGRFRICDNAVQLSRVDSTGIEADVGSELLVTDNTISFLAGDAYDSGSHGIHTTTDAGLVATGNVIQSPAGVDAIDASATSSSLLRVTANDLGLGIASATNAGQAIFRDNRLDGTVTFVGCDDVVVSDNVMGSLSSESIVVNMTSGGAAQVQDNKTQGRIRVLPRLTGRIFQDHDRYFFDRGAALRVSTNLLLLGEMLGATDRGSATTRRMEATEAPAAINAEDGQALAAKSIGYDDYASLLIEGVESRYLDDLTTRLDEKAPEYRQPWNAGDILTLLFYDESPYEAQVEDNWATVVQVGYAPNQSVSFDGFTYNHYDPHDDTSVQVVGNWASSLLLVNLYDSRLITSNSVGELVTGGGGFSNRVFVSENTYDNWS